MTVGSTNDLTLTQGSNPVFSACHALLPEVHQQDSYMLTQEHLQKLRFLQKSHTPVPTRRGSQFPHTDIVAELLLPKHAHLVLHSWHLLGSDTLHVLA